jgi:hypothetical protein
VSSRFADQYGTELEVSGETAHPGCARVWVSARCGIHVKPADFPAFIAALYEAAGLPAPVILERPGRVSCDQLCADGFRTYLATGNLVGVDGQPDDISPAAARFLAARLAALADIAESEPDPAEVAELALILRGLTPGVAYATEGDYKLAVVTPYAEAALRWFRDKQQQGGGADA